VDIIENNEGNIDTEINIPTEDTKVTSEIEETPIPEEIVSSETIPHETNQASDETHDTPENTSEADDKMTEKPESDFSQNEAGSPEFRNNLPGDDKILVAIDSMKDEVKGLGGQIFKMEAMTKKMAENVASEARGMHKLYHQEFSGRLQSMQAEIERYRERDKSTIYDVILADVAKLYSSNIDVLKDVNDEKLENWLGDIFKQILEILEFFGVSKLESQPGDKRNTRHSQIIERVSTDEPEKNDTVLRCKNVGFYIENRTLVRERIDIYVYKNTNDEKSSEK